MQVFARVVGGAAGEGGTTRGIAAAAGPIAATAGEGARGTIGRTRAEIETIDTIVGDDGWSGALVN